MLFTVCIAKFFTIIHIKLPTFQNISRPIQKINRFQRFWNNLSVQHHWPQFQQPITSLLYQHVIITFIRHACIVGISKITKSRTLKSNPIYIELEKKLCLTFEVAVASTDLSTFLDGITCQPRGHRFTSARNCMQFGT